MSDYISMLGERVTECTKSLNRNWTAQCILSIAGLVSIHSHELAEDLLDAPSGLLSVSVDSLAILIPAALFVLYIRFGYLLWYYFFTRTLEEREWIKGEQDESKLVEIRDVLTRQMVFDPVYTQRYPHYRGLHHKIAFKLLTVCLAFTISLNHIATISLVIFLHLSSALTVVIITAYILFMAAFYFQYWRMPGIPEGRKLALITLMFAVSFFVIGLIWQFSWIP